MPCEWETKDEVSDSKRDGRREAYSFSALSNLTRLSLVVGWDCSSCRNARSLLLLSFLLLSLAIPNTVVLLPFVFALVGGGGGSTLRPLAIAILPRRLLLRRRSAILGLGSTWRSNVSALSSRSSGGSRSHLDVLAPSCASGNAGGLLLRLPCLPETLPLAWFARVLGLVVSRLRLRLRVSPFGGGLITTAGQRKVSTDH